MGRNFYFYFFFGWSLLSCWRCSQVRGELWYLQMLGMLMRTWNQSRMRYVSCLLFPVIKIKHSEGNTSETELSTKSPLLRPTTRSPMAWWQAKCVRDLWQIHWNHVRLLFAVWTSEEPSFTCKWATGFWGSALEGALNPLHANSWKLTHNFTTEATVMTLLWMILVS